MIRWLKNESHTKSIVTSESLFHSNKELSLKLPSWFLICLSWQLTHNSALLRTEGMRFVITEAILEKESRFHISCLSHHPGNEVHFASRNLITISICWMRACQNCVFFPALTLRSSIVTELSGFDDPKGNKKKTLVNGIGLKELRAGRNVIYFQLILFYCWAYKLHLPSVSRWTQISDHA